MSEVVRYLIEQLGSRKEALELIKKALGGARNAVVHSIQVRVPDVLLIALLVGGGRQKTLEILRQGLFVVAKHTGQLATFVFLYRVFSGSLQQRLGPPLAVHSFGSAALASLLVYRTTAPTNDDSQLMYFLLARILGGLVNLGVKKEVLPQTRPAVYPLIFALIGGTILWLFEHHPKSLSPNLRYSMRALYKS